MKTYLSRTEKVIAALVVVVILSFFGLLKNINKSKNLSQIDTVEAINYKMARPEAAYSDYSLDGREEDRVIDAVKKKAIQQKIELEKKTVAEKKAAEDKKKNEKAAAEKKQQVAKQVAKLQEVKKALVSKLVAKRSAQAQESAKSNGYDYSSNSGGASVSQNNNNTPAATEPVKAEEKKSIAEWKTLIQSKGAEAMAEFITAFRKGEVNGADYNTVVTELLSSDDNKQKALGLMGLKANNSAQSLKQLLTLDSAKFVGFESYIQTSIKSYLLPQNLGYLSQVLRSQDKVAVVKALDLLVASLGDGSDDISVLADRGGRNVDTTVNLNVSSYQVLLPALEQLTKSDDANIADLASSVASKIDSDVSAVAQN